MSNDVKKFSKPVGEDSIYKLMLIITFAVAGAFFVKNIIGFSLVGMISIGGCLLAFAAALFIMKLIKLHKRKKQLVVCVMLMFLVFVVSLFSGNFYSDDFTLYLVVIALSGMYLEPTVTKVQTVLVNVLLALQYIINPGKADPLSQYIMCMVLTTLTSILFLQVIKRGRCFIQVGLDRSEEAEGLVDSITKAGMELQKNCETSAKRVEGLQDASETLELRTRELKAGSDNIILGANIENASYGLTMCAERNTVFRTILSGYKTEDMVAMALCAEADEVPYPCGACRQVLSELFPLDAPIYVHNTKGKILETNVKELLPYIFNKENMD